MIPIAVAILGIIGVAIPPLAKWLERKTGGYSVWKSEITYWNLPLSSIGGRFFGRATELKAVADAFKRGHHVALSGMPGVGKSQLAAEFVKKSKLKGFWTPGGNTVAETMIALARHLGIEHEGKSEDAVLFQIRQRLHALPGKTLWVIDNLSDLDQLNSLFGQIGKIAVLVTSQDSRNNVVPDGLDFQPVGVLDPEAAVQLLCRGSRHDVSQPVFLELVEEVGHLPRAVEALAVQLDSPGETPERLLEELRATPNPLELERFRNQTAGLQIPRTESLFNALRGPVDALPPGIRESLAPMGYTADLPIPMPLAEALTGLSGGSLINFFDECSAKSVLSVVGEQVTLHSLTAAAIAATNPGDSLQTALKFTNDRLGPIINNRQVVPTIEIDHYAQIASWASLELDKSDRGALALSNNLANAYLMAGDYQKSERLHQAVLEIREQTLGPDDADTLTSRNNLATVCNFTGRYDEACNLHQTILEARERILGTDHRQTLVSRGNLASSYRSAGRYDEALLLNQETHDALLRLLGPEHPDTLNSQNNLATTYDSLGYYDEAAEIHGNILNTLQGFLNPEHPDILGTRNNLANSYHNAGRDEDALPLLEETRDSLLQVLGPEHSNTLSCCSNLASVYDSLGHYDQAVELLLETSKVMEHVLGPEHPITLTCYNNLAGSYHHAGRSNHAVNLLKETLETGERILGSGHPTILIIRENLAKMFGELGQDIDADTL